MRRPPSRTSRDRRRLLIVGGLGAASFGLLRKLPDPSPTTTTVPTVTVRQPVPPAELGQPPGTTTTTTLPDDHVFEKVIERGRVIDPETGFDQIAQVGIDGPTITKISTEDEPLEARRRIDASGLVVAPGFIDVLSYEPNDYGIWYKVHDGVTTNLAMHGINMEAADFFDVFDGQVPIHYGGAFDSPFMRFDQLALDGGDTAESWQIEQMSTDVAQSFDDGFVGIDFEPEYSPGVDINELIELSRSAASADLPVCFHVRYSDPERNLDAIAEVLDVARETGAAVHIDHITSTGGTGTMEKTLSVLTDARAEGIDVTADMYPYDFWATTLLATRYGVDPETGETAVERFDIDYEDLQIVGTGERLDEITFLQLQLDKKNPLVAALDTIPEEEIEAALRADFVMIGSDSILEPGDKNHPRSTGTFARVLGRYVRERQTITLPNALSKMTIQPAQLLESGVPVMRRKGRIQVGADADITVFDPETISDKGTVEEPAQRSVGVKYVFVVGNVVKSPDGLDRSVIEGMPITQDTV